ncbi:MAG: diaminopropionate ammonia-lyase [Phycisphaerales bacterium]|nr:diaminopropionate ammonia-lyase [Phycisphaerales bacterium]
MIRRHLRNDQVCIGQCCPRPLGEVIPVSARRQARAVIGGWSGYRPTELRSLEAIADELGLGAVFYKDEQSRFELSSFKALGGAYAVQLVLRDAMARSMGREIALEEIEDGHHPEVASAITVVTATDGNHGRSVAWGAERFGCKCVIYMHEDVSRGRVEAVEAFGATVRRVEGNYDDSVRAAAAAADEHGWLVVSDTSWPGYLEIPRHVMAGYTVMSGEAMEQWPLDAPPTHVFLQGGCGGMAAAVCVDLWSRYGVDRPRVVIVEPEPAACLFESAAAGELRMVNITTETVMAGLSCGEVSLIAWPILQAAVEDFLTITDQPVGPLMRRLAVEESIVAGESAVAGLAGLMAAAGDRDLARGLGLSSESRVLLFGTEGATDPEVYRRLIE